MPESGWHMMKTVKEWRIYMYMHGYNGLCAQVVIYARFWDSIWIFHLVYLHLLRSLFFLSIPLLCLSNLSLQVILWSVQFSILFTLHLSSIKKTITWHVVLHYHCFLLQIFRIHFQFSLFPFLAKVHFYCLSSLHTFPFCVWTVSWSDTMFFLLHVWKCCIFSVVTKGQIWQYTSDRKDRIWKHNIHYMSSLFTVMI